MLNIALLAVCVGPFTIELGRKQMRCALASRLITQGVTEIMLP